MSKTIALSGKKGAGKFAVVDDQWYDELARHKWFISTEGYAIRNLPWAETSRGSRITMHRVVNRTPPGMITDHINGDRLDNREANLRTVTSAQNRQNTKPREGCTSKYVGVSWNPRVHKWQAYARKDGVAVYLGAHATEREAAMARDAWTRANFPTYGTLNFPERDHD